MTAPLDRDRLADVLRGGASSEAAFLAEFRRSVDIDAGELRDAAASGDLTRAEQLAHRIEGACRVVGAGAMAGACSVLVAACVSGDAGRVRHALGEFVDCKRALELFLDAPQAESETAAAPHDAGGEQICLGLVFLVVEDHEFQRGLIVRLLRQLGAREVHGFADGAAALVAARATQEPVVLVLDLAMPQVNGMEVMRIAAQEQLPVAVIMNSALAEDMLRWPLQTARSYGANVLGAVSKPLTAGKLAPLLAQHRHGKPLGAAKPSALR